MRNRIAQLVAKQVKDLMVPGSNSSEGMNGRRECMARPEQKEDHVDYPKEDSLTRPHPGQILRDAGSRGSA